MRKRQIWGGWEDGKRAQKTHGKFRGGEDLRRRDVSESNIRGGLSARKVLSKATIAEDRNGGKFSFLDGETTLMGGVKEKRNSQ